MNIRKLLPILIVIIPLLSFVQPAGKGITVAIQPFGEIPPSYVSYFYQEASRIIPGIIIKETIQLPKSAFYAPRSRYRADSLIFFLERNTPNGQVTIMQDAKGHNTTAQEQGFCGNCKAKLKAKGWRF